MTEHNEQLLYKLDSKIIELITLCNRQKSEIIALTSAIAERDQTIAHSRREIDILNSRCSNMLTAKVLSTNKEELQNARHKISKMVQEVDKCIALING